MIIVYVRNNTVISDMYELLICNQAKNKLMTIIEIQEKYICLFMPSRLCHNFKLCLLSKKIKYDEPTYVRDPIHARLRCVVFLSRHNDGVNHFFLVACGKGSIISCETSIVPLKNKCTVDADLTLTLTKYSFCFH